MTKVKIQIGKEGVEKGLASGDFVDPPPGLYVVEVRQAEQRQKDGGEHPYINVGAFPIGRGRKGEALNPPEGSVFGTVWDKVSLSPAAEWRLTQFCIAMGMKVNARGGISGSLELEADKPGSIIKKLALLRVKEGQNLEGQYRAEVGWWGPYDPTDDGEGFDEEEELGDEEATEDAFGEDEPEGEEEEEYYTREFLQSLEPKELSKACTDFDLDPDSLKVKGRGGKLDVPKSLAAMVDAILEAQGVDEGEGEPEDPF